jgi:hydroxylamine reductase
VCGNEEVTADLQDVLLHQLKGIGQHRNRLGALGRQLDLAARPPQREFRR